MAREHGGWGEGAALECGDVYAALALLLKGLGIRAVVVCVDSLAPGEFEFFRWAQRQRPEVRLFAYSNRDDHEAMQMAMQHGVRALASATGGIEGLGRHGGTGARSHDELRITNYELRRGVSAAGQEGTAHRAVAHDELRITNDELRKQSSANEAAGDAHRRVEHDEIGEVAGEEGAAGRGDGQRLRDRRVMAEASRAHDEVPLIGTEGLGFAAEDDEDFSADEDEGVIAEGCEADFEPACPFRVCGIGDDDAEEHEEEAVEEVTESESGAHAEEELTRGVGSAERTASGVEVEPEEDEGAGRDASPTAEEDLRGPVRVPWLRYGDAPRRSKPGENVENSKIRKVEREGIEGVARHEGTEARRHEGQGIEDELRVTSYELQRGVGAAGQEGAAHRAVAHGELPITNDELRGRENANEAARDACGAVTGGDRADGSRAAPDEASAISDLRSQISDTASPRESQISGTSGAEGRELPITNYELPGLSRAQELTPPPALPSTEGNWPPEYYEPLLTEAELRALMSDEDIELRDEEREALLGEENVETSKRQNVKMEGEEAD